MVSHDVFFSLKEGTAENKKTLVEACHKYLKGHPGEVFYSAGVLAEDLKRPVNDLNFDVALHIVFNDKASQDKYQDAPRHLEFIEKNKSLWKSVRVFDSYVSK
ncbi:MAG: Dabb family protein [Planctomycetes bacterium]|nr:Dabb family protein [Planctomycetota bacterium]NBY01326.1 Dabb family protein [Planctomycetota bacterium]